MGLLDRKKLYEAMELGGFAGRGAALFEVFMVILISANVIAVVLETVPAIEARFSRFFSIFELVSISIFSLEYAARLWVAAERDAQPGESTMLTRLRYMMRPLSLVDLMAILPFYLFAAGDWRALRLLRLVRMLKLIRYSAALVSLTRVIYEERRALLAALVIMLCSLFFAATILYMIEREVQPVAFGTIPDALWWAIATLTTVGYGDAVPVTAMGKAAGGLLMIFGLALYALPVGILASGFSQEIRRRQFLVPVGLLRRMLIFEGLDELSLRDIASRMRTLAVPASEVVVHRRASGGGLYLIITGTASAVVSDEHIALSEGDFFGELSFLSDGDRHPAIYAQSRLRLLHLDSADLDMVLSLYPEIRHNLLRIGEGRLDALHRAGQMDAAAAQAASLRLASRLDTI